MAVLKTTSPVVLPFAPTETPRNTVPSSRASTAGVDTPVPRFAPRAFRRCAKRESLFKNGLPLQGVDRASLPGANINDHGDHCLWLIQSQHVVHRIQAGRPPGKPRGCPQCTVRECDAVGGPMRNLHPLAGNREDHRMLSDDVAGPQHRKSDVPRSSRSVHTMPVEYRNIRELY